MHPTHQDEPTSFVGAAIRKGQCHHYVAFTFLQQRQVSIAHSHRLLCHVVHCTMLFILTLTNPDFGQSQQRVPRMFIAETHGVNQATSLVLKHITAAMITPAVHTPRGDSLMWVWHRMWLLICSLSYDTLAVVPLLHTLSLKLIRVWKYFRIKHFFFFLPLTRVIVFPLAPCCLTGGWGFRSRHEKKLFSADSWVNGHGQKSVFVPRPDVGDNEPAPNEGWISPGAVLLLFLPRGRLL